MHTRYGYDVNHGDHENNTSIRVVVNVSKETILVSDFVCVFLVQICDSIVRKAWNDTQQTRYIIDGNFFTERFGFRFFALSIALLSLLLRLALPF